MSERFGYEHDGAETLFESCHMQSRRRQFPFWEEEEEKEEAFTWT